MSMGNLAMLFLDQLVDVGINAGSPYAQRCWVRNLEFLSWTSHASFWRRTAHKYVLFIGFYVTYQMQSVPSECGKHLTILNTAV
jgi:hypothetical protein